MGVDTGVRFGRGGTTMVLTHHEVGGWERMGQCGGERRGGGGMWRGGQGMRLGETAGWVGECGEVGPGA